MKFIKKVGERGHKYHMSPDKKYCLLCLHLSYD